MPAAAAADVQRRRTLARLASPTAAAVAANILALQIESLYVYLHNLGWLSRCSSACAPLVAR